MQRPDYKEFIEKIKILEESIQRQESQHKRQEELIRKREKPLDIQETRAKLLREYPWLDGTANPSSVVNSEFLYEQLKKQNWGEVVAGLCNAIEEELKQSVYKEYLAFRAEFNTQFAEESARQRKQGSVLYFVASIINEPMNYYIWEQFVTKRMPKHKEFILEELPRLLSKLLKLRNPSTHGKMSEKEIAKRARQIVLGTRGKVGLLERLRMTRI